MVVILDCPVNRIARQSVPAVERGEVPIFQTAQSSLGRSPENTVAVESQAVDPALAQPVSEGVRFANRLVFEIVDSSLIESQPKASVGGISGNRHRVILMPQPGPGNLLHFLPTPYA